MKQNNLSVRWAILAAGVGTMLFAGIIYAWSILKVPFAESFDFAPSALALNFTLTMSFFCIGGLLSSQLVRRIGTRLTILLSGLLAGLGFILSPIVGVRGPIALYVTYAFMAGLGIGMAYIVIISTVNAWFPDRKGLSSGTLMMGFGASTLILGSLVDKLFATSLGFKNTYILVGVAIAAVISLSSFVIKAPTADTPLPERRRIATASRETFEMKDYHPSEMVKRFTFWRAFVALLCLTAVGSSVISFARDLALSVNAGAALATTLVGVLSICNGLGRIITGAIFDLKGRKFTMIAASALTVIAAATTLVAINMGSLVVLIVGLCLTGLSYGTAPTIASAFVAAFYGQKHFAANLSICNFNLMAASFIATACSSLLTISGGYTAPFILLLSLSSLSLALNFSIRRP